jgi:inner membrane protein
VLTSVALARAGLQKTTRLALPIVMVAGLAPELDTLSMLGGAGAYVHVNRTVTHSLLGAVVLAVVVALVFTRLGSKHPTAPVCFRPALVAALIGAGAHLLMDVTTSYGVRLLWPFSGKWFALDWADEVDLWLVFALVAGFLLPELFRLVTEEIGARPAERGRRRAAIFLLSLVAVYLGARAYLHSEATALLDSHMYHGNTPRAVGAFPLGVSPLRWHGVVATENTLEEVEVPFGPGAVFDPDRSRTYFKPESSPALEAAHQTEVVQAFLRFAQFPSASLVREGAGYRVVVQDLRFSDERRLGASVIVVVDLNNLGEVVGEHFEFASK